LHTCSGILTPSAPDVHTAPRSACLHGIENGCPQCIHMNGVQLPLLPGLYVGLCAYSQACLLVCVYPSEAGPAHAKVKAPGPVMIARKPGRQRLVPNDQISARSWTLFSPLSRSVTNRPNRRAMDVCNRVRCSSSNTVQQYRQRGEDRRRRQIQAPVKLRLSTLDGSN
jgi:hypothetical protein